MPRYNPPTRPDPRFRVGDYLTVPEVCEYLGLSRRMVFYLKKTKALPFEKNERTTMIELLCSVVQPSAWVSEIFQLLILSVVGYMGGVL